MEESQDRHKTSETSKGGRQMSKELESADDNALGRPPIELQVVENRIKVRGSQKKG